MPDQPPGLRLPEDLVQREVAAICARYRITPEDARAILLETFAARPALVYEIAARHPAEDVTRLRAYKDALKAAKKQVYYALRQYHQDQDEEADRLARLAALIEAGADDAALRPALADLLRGHVSTRERAAHYVEFYAQWFDLLGAPPRTVLDVGCGLHPLSYPFGDAARCPDRYVALDRDAAAIETLQVYAAHVGPERLVAAVADVGEARWLEYLPPGTDRFDAALLLKLVPVLHRQQRELLPRLAALPARRLLVTASAQAMTRHEDITRREDRVLREFIAASGRPVLGELRLENEFGYLLGDA
ncbi:MAG: hypothetical protein JW910_07460 [Anaerolineae bacterium]|nr:hypothetical protein [Anaerolineae bacterium]